MSRRCTGCCSAGGGPTRSTRGPACTASRPTRCPRWPLPPTCSARPTTLRRRRCSARPRRWRRPGCSSPASTGQGGGSRISTARCESTAELLCAELSADGLPVDRAAAERLLTEITGPRPRGPADAAAIRAARDARVLRHAPGGDGERPAQPGSGQGAARARRGSTCPTPGRAGLSEFRESSPLVAALLEWRKAERIATTYGYSWLDEHLGADGRLRGAWTGCDGAAGRMTASSGLHNMPAVLRRAVLAEDGHVFVRADLGQIEPRVLAAVSGDGALAAATAADDMYLPVAAELGVDRPTAKVAMIAAMYGQTTGHGGVAARRMRAAYPVAMGYLDGADRSARRRPGPAHLRWPAAADVRRRQRGGSRQVRAERGGAGRGGRAVQDVGGDGTGAGPRRLAGGSCSACMTSCCCTCLPAERRSWRGWSAAASRRRQGGGRRAGRVRFIADISVAGSWADAKG